MIIGSYSGEKDCRVALRVEGTKMSKKESEYLESCLQFSVAEALEWDKEEGDKPGEESVYELKLILKAAGK